MATGHKPIALQSPWDRLCYALPFCYAIQCVAGGCYALGGVQTLCKILAHNLCVLIQEQHELGIDPVFWKNETEEAVSAVANEPESDCYGLLPMAN